jgi:C4-dicarboxylate transporter, DctM subunit
VIALLLLVMALVALGVPIAIALGLPTAAFLAHSGVRLNIVPLILFGSLENFVLLALPLFMIAGEVANRAGLAEQLVDLISSAFGWMRGGLAQCATVGGMVFAEISGSSVADAASLTTIMVPAMEQRGYPKEFAAAVTSAAAAVAIIVAPSIPLIVYGAAAEQSVGKMFVAGVIPAIVLALSMMLFNFYFAWRFGWKREGRFEAGRLLRALRNGIWGLALPVIVLGGILGGVFTPTEAGAVAVVASLAIGCLITRRVALSDIPGIVLIAARRTGAVLLLVAASSVFGWYLTDQGIPQRIAAWILSLSSNPAVAMFMLNLALLALGTLVHGVAAIMLIVPIVLPTVIQLGYNPIHFGIILALNLAIGNQVPPTGAVLMTASAISGADVTAIMHYNKWFIVCMFGVLQLVTYVPGLSLWLPAHLMPR